MVSKEEVEHMARLARLEMGVRETAKMGKELSSILDYIDELKELDVSKVEPLFYSNILENVARKDVPQTRSAEETTLLLKLAPESEKRFVRVRNILKHGN